MKEFVQTIVGLASPTERKNLARGMMFNGAAAACEALIPLVVIGLFYMAIEGAAFLKMAQFWWLVAIILFSFGILRFLCLNAANQRCYHAGFRVGYAIRRRLLARYAQADFEEFAREGSGSLATFITDTVNHLEHLVAHAGGQVVACLMRLILFVSALLIVDWQLGIVMMAVLAITIPLTIIVNRRLSVLTSKMGAMIKQSSRDMAETLRGLPALKAFNLEKGERVKQFRAVNEQMAREGRRALATIAPFVFSNLIMADLAIVCTILVGAYLVALDSVTSATMIAASLLAIATLIPIAQLLKLYIFIQAGRMAFARIHPFLVETSQDKIQQTSEPRGFDIVADRLELDYADGSPGLRCVSFSLPEGELLALVGPSGSGKSSLIKLIAGLHKPTSGSLKIGGVETIELGVSYLGDQVALASLDTPLLSGTIADNIRLGRPDANLDEIKRVAHLAGVDDVTTHLPEGLEAHVGDGGSRLSGGERARVVLARALLKNAPILLLDEATAALDPTNEAIITQAILKLRGKATVIVATHRLTTAAQLGRIVVVDGGKVVAIDKHEALLESCELYRRLWQRQISSDAWQIIADPA